ncbi:MAG: hypothetical protein ACLTDS_05570 [Bianqueaceae bacterium]
MHAGEANNSIGQRAHGVNFHAATVKTTTTAEIQNEKCTPVRRTTAAASGHAEAISTPPPARRSGRRRYRMKNALRRGNNGCGQRAHGVNFHAATGETIRPAEIQNEICTPA